MSTLWKISGEWPTDCDETHDQTLIGTVWFNKHTGREATIVKVVRIRGAKNPICVLDDGEPEECWNSDFMINHWYPHPQVPDGWVRDTCEPLGSDIGHLLADEDNDAEFYLRIIGGNDIQSYLEEWREWRANQ